MKTVRRLITILLSLTLILSLCGVAVANGEKPYRYVAIGDSTCSGYNSDEYVFGGQYDLKCGENKELYPNLMGAYLRETLGREVEVNCILPSGIRAHDLRAILDPEYVGDVYCKNHIAQWSDLYGSYETLHKTVCGAITDADLLSIDVCMSSMGNYFIDRIKCALGFGDKDYSANFGRDKLSAYLGGDYDREIYALSAYRSVAEEILNHYEFPTETVSKIIDAYEYSVGSLMINFSETVKLIYELNDDIQLIVMSPFSTTCYDLTLTVGGKRISLGDILHLYLTAMNHYIVSVDPNHNRYRVADMYHTSLRCFTDAIADGEWDRYTYVTEEIRKILLSHHVPVDSNIPEQEKYFRETVCKNVEKALADTKFNLTVAPLDLLKAILHGDGNLVDSLIKEAADNYHRASESARLALRVVFVFESWGCHPDYSGHMQKYKAVQSAYQKFDTRA